MPRNQKTHPLKKCPGCGKELSYDRSYGIHAGFSNEGFLYNDAGTDVFWWSSFDPDYIAIVGENHPWALSPEDQDRVENALAPAPDGGRWRFANPARCPDCGAAISGPITETIMGLQFDGSTGPNTEATSAEIPFAAYLAH